MLIVPFAHGALGWWDEIFVALAIGIFIVMFLAPMLNTTLRRGRAEAPEVSESAPKQTSQADQKPDTFRLE